MKKKYFGKYVFLSFIIVFSIFIVNAIVNVKLFNNGEFLQQLFSFNFNKPIGYIKLITSIMIIIFGIFIEYIVSENKKLEMELTVKNERFELAMNAGNHGFWEINVKEDKIYYSPMYYKMLGYEYEEFPMDRTVFNRLMHPDDKKEILPKILECLNDAKSYEEEFRLKCKDGSWKWILGRSRGYVKNENGIVEKIVGTHSDISKLKEEQLKVLENKEKYQLLFENMISGFCLCEIIYDSTGRIDHTFIEVNSKFQEIIGINKAKLIGLSVREVLPFIDETLLTRFNEVVLTGKSFTDEWYNKKSDKYFEISVFSIKNNKFAVIITDITLKKKIRTKIKFKTYHDELTGIYNRTYFNEKIMQYNSKMELPLGIIIGDVNGLKITNDIFGHKKGDELLLEIAQIIKKNCRKQDLIARIGGDEFIIVLPKISDKEINNIYSNIKNDCKKSNLNSIQLSIALGYAIKYDEKENLQSVFKKAEDSMYKNKVIESKEVQSVMIKALRGMLKEKANKTIEQIEKNSLIIGKELNLNQEDLYRLKLLANVYDIGKVVIDNKTSDNEEVLHLIENEKMKRHCEMGYRIAKHSKELSIVADEILYHHEKFDGSGYPEGLIGNNIPLLSRIIAVVDSYDMIINSKTTNEIISKNVAVEELRKLSGAKLDPEIVDIFIKKILLNKKTPTNVEV